MSKIADSAESSVSVTSLTLVERLKNRDQEAWRRMVRLYGRRIYHWCRRSGADPDSAADLVQQVYQAVAENIHTFRRDRTGDSFRGWLRTITRNKVRDYQRARQRLIPATGGSSALGQWNQLPDELHDSADSNQNTDELRRVVHEAIGLVRQQANETHWSAFWETVVNNRDASEVAQELGVSRDVVYKGKSRVLATLRQVLSDIDERV
jgi:RNA polymerase sigma-70 factor (ECF subfamily)